MATRESLGRISLGDIEGSYRRFITPSRSYLTIVGDIKAGEAKNLVEENFAAWKGSTLHLVHFKKVLELVRTEVDCVDMPGVSQSEICIANIVNLGLDNPDYVPALLANYILGGGFTSRLNMNLREKRGFSYGAFSDIGTGRFQQMFKVSALVKTEKTDSAILEMLFEIKRLNNERVDSNALANAKAQFSGSFALGLESAVRVSGLAKDIMINDLRPDFYKTFLKKVNEVSAQDIMRVARSYFHYSPTRIIVTGNMAKIRGQMSALGYAGIN